jgi:hypothetical protein
MPASARKAKHFWAKQHHPHICDPAEFLNVLAFRSNSSFVD